MKPRSFKLVKKYPNSENIGSIWTKTPETKNYWYMNCYLDPADVENNPEFFEEIIQKEYEVLSFICNKDLDSSIILKGIIIKKLGGGGFGGGVIRGSEEKLLTLSHWDIHSIRRLSDSEVFSIGDELVDTFNRNHGKFTLKEIEFEKAPADKGTGKLSFVHTHTILGKYIPLERLEKAKPVLFVTHDGYEMFEGFLVHLICLPLTSTQVYNFDKPFKIPENWKPQSYVETFFQIHNAEEFVFKNKPVLSLEDVASIYPGINKEHNTPNHQAEQLKALVKSRL